MPKRQATQKSGRVRVAVLPQDDPSPKTPEGTHKPGPGPRHCGKSKRTFLPKYLEDFCHLIHEGYSQREAGVMVGRSARAGMKFAQRPEVRERIEEIAREYGQTMTAERVKMAVLREEFIDEQVMEMAANGEGGGKRGRLTACRLAYEKMRLINPPNAQTLLALSMTQQGGQGFTAPKLYEARRFSKLQEEGEYKSDHLALALPAAPSTPEEPK